MRAEIERKFLVVGDGWRAGSEATEIRQGYLCGDAARSVRVRCGGGHGYLTVKGSAVGIRRSEYEYEIPVADAESLLDTLCLRPLIEKTRHLLVHRGIEWVVDVFTGDNAGLVVAEVELADEAEAIELPEWVGREVTGDPRYLNVNLARNPFTRW
jgi:CYTH domain-containing protein